MRFALFLALFIALSASLASSAIVSGSIYSTESFEPLSNAVISVNSIPEQRIIAKDSNYSFELPAGTYNIAAKFFENSELRLEGFETITVSSEGSFRLDLVLFPAEQDANLFEELNQELPNNGISPEEFKITVFDLVWPLMLAVLIALLAIMLYFGYFKKKPIEESLEAKEEQKAEIAEIPEAKEKPKRVLDKNAEEVLQALRNKGNRATQKELLEKVHFGEAYLSLVLAELESEGKIKKIKKGRGNIIILKEN